MSASTTLDTLSLTVLGCSVRVECEDAEARALLEVNYCRLQGNQGWLDLAYAVGRQPRSPAFFIQREGQDALLASDAGDFLYQFEKDMTIELEKLRRDLYFVHGAVLEFAGKACMLVGPSGSGKSTTTWALLHHGFRYLSDELAPVDLETLEVVPYPHALCLKAEPPASYPLPTATLRTSRTLYVPIANLPSGVGSDPTPLATLFFVRYRPEIAVPTIRPMSKAEAAMRLFTNALNPLAHPEDGLDGAIAITTRCACFELFVADLHATCALMNATLKELFRD